MEARQRHALIRRLDKSVFRLVGEFDSGYDRCMLRSAPQSHSPADDLDVCCNRMRTGEILDAAKTTCSINLHVLDRRVLCAQHAHAERAGIAGPKVDVDVDQVEVE